MSDKSTLEYMLKVREELEKNTHREQLPYIISRDQAIFAGLNPDNLPPGYSLAKPL